MEVSTFIQDYKCRILAVSLSTSRHVMIYQFLTTHFGCWFLFLFLVACFLWLACCNFAPSSNFEQVSKNTLLSWSCPENSMKSKFEDHPPPKKKKEKTNNKRSTSAKRKAFFLWSLPLEMPWVVPTFPVIFTRIFLEFLRLQRSQLFLIYTFI